MLYFLLALTVSFCIALMIVRTSHFHGSLTSDNEMYGAQKMHRSPVPRIGGLAVFAGLLAVLFYARRAGSEFGQDSPVPLLLVAGFPVFAAGLAEDLTKTVSPRWRLIFALISGWLAYQLLGSAVVRTSIPGVDSILAIGFVSATITIVAIASVVNAVNIIDGFNGLAAGVCGMLCASLAYVAFKVGDLHVLYLSLAMSGALVGFFLLNYPFGRLFLGDGGAYFCGFVVAVLVVLLVQRNPAVSPWYAAALLIYPVFEVIFSIYRRVKRKHVATHPDAIHLHTLFYRRVVGPHSPSDYSNIKVLRNSMTSPYLWVLNSLAVIPATLLWNSTVWLAVTCTLFCVLYVWLYSRIIRFRTPVWLIL